MENELNVPDQLEKKSKLWVWIIIVIIVIVGVILTLSLLGNKKSSSDEAAVVDSETDVVEEEQYVEPYNEEYVWSKKNEGPYNDSVSFAVSTDLLNWKDSGVTLAEHASVPDVVYKDGTLYAYFVDVSTDGYKEKVGLVKSSDGGKTWSSRELISIKGLNEKAAVDPTPNLLEDGRIRLFYLDLAEMRKPESKGKMIKNKIYSAVSSDGVNFVEEDGVRFEYSGIFDPSVIKVSDNLWRMYVGNEDGMKVYSATSSDGLAFIYEGVAFSGGAIPDVVSEDGKYFMFTGGIDISSSVDGKVFTRIGKRFEKTGGLTADPGVVKLSDGSYLMVYKTKPMMKKN